MYATGHFDKRVAKNVHNLRKPLLKDKLFGTGYIVPKPAQSEENYDYKDRKGYTENKHKDTPSADVEKVTFQPKLATFEMDVMDSMGIKEERRPKKTWWY